VDRDGFPRFSPDGKQLAFVRQSGRGGRAAGGANPWAILVAEAATGTAREVWRSTADAAGALPFMAGSHLLQWGADNRLIFTSEQDGWMHLYSDGRAADPVDAGAVRGRAGHAHAGSALGSLFLELRRHRPSSPVARLGQWRSAYPTHFGRRD
jgi:hypothetical protein